MSQDQIERHDPSLPAGLLLLLGLGLLLGLYPLLRYGIWWGETDAATLMTTIIALLESGALAPAGHAYANGYAYPALVAWLAVFTGLPLGFLQLLGGSLLLVWVIVPAWLCYREFTRSRLAAGLSLLILLAQPEFIFPLLRGTHEKFTRGLMFLCLYLLLRSLRERHPPRLAMLLVSFYLCAYALVASNTFMATSFILAILLALGLLWLAARWFSHPGAFASPPVARFLYVTLSLFIISYVFILYLYPPAQNQLFILKSIWDRTALLLLEMEQVAANPYSAVNAGWISLPVYLLVSLANWLLLGFSLLLWLKQTLDGLLRRLPPARHTLILWAFYTAFAFLSLLSILVDVSGALAANLQHRIYPSFAMLAAPLLGAWLAETAFSAPARWRWLPAAAGVSLAVLMVLSLFKATAEPLLSNYWVFYTPAERRSLDWAERTLAGRSLWTGPFGRIRDAYVIHTNGRVLDVILDPYWRRNDTRDFLLSDMTLLHAMRLGDQMAIPGENLLTYDNGRAQIYHRRPLTPFQK